MTTKKLIELAKDKNIKILEDYKGTRKAKHLGIVTSGKFKGCECIVTYDYLDRKITSNNPNIRMLTDKGKKQYFTNRAKERGYDIIEYPEKLQSTKFCKLKSPKGNIWRVNWNSFDNNKNNNCPADNTKSIGERIIQTILEENNITYTSEKSIKTKNKRIQRLDFYFEIGNKKYAIEYMGEQHFKQATGTWSKPLEEIKELDRKKEDYCKENNISLLYINYPNEDKKEILKYISNFINIELQYTNKIEHFTKHNEKEKDIITFYSTHTIEETARAFKITKNQVKSILNKTKFTKRFEKIIGLNVKTGEELEFNSIKEAEEYIGYKGVNRSILGKSKLCGGYMWRYKNRDFSEKSKTITDKRIKVYEIKKGDLKESLPLQMIEHQYGLERSSIIEVVNGRRKTVRGFSVREVSNEEKEYILSRISYVDYIRSTHLIN